MSSLFKPDTSAQEESLRKQEDKLKAKEAQQASELKARKAASGQSRTLFSAVLGEDKAIAKKTKLGQ